MSLQIKIFLCTLLCLLLTPMPAYTANEDIEGSADHPLISRYPGSVIYEYDVREYDEYILPVAPLEWGEFTETLLLEGKVTKIRYGGVKGRSTLEVYRNYQSALKNANFEVLFEEQGRSLSEVYTWLQALYPRRIGPGNDFRYFAAKLTHPAGDVYVSLFITTGDMTTTLLDIIEMVPLEGDLIRVDADSMRREIERAGFVAIYGIYFKTDEAEMTDASKPTLDEIAKLLKDNPELNLFVVGHTDNVGGYDYNLNLSGRRAESVVAALVRDYDIPEERLIPVGVGPVSPVASNTTEEGRARNRRVEFVRR